MILDTSAVAAMFFGEPGAELLRDKVAKATEIGIGTATLTETGIVLASKLGEDAVTDLHEFLVTVAIVIIPFGEVHWQAAVGAFIRFGRGRHPARLNFGDCMSYATAKIAGQPLLYVGKDFAQTDLESA